MPGYGILNVGDQTRIYHGQWQNVVLKAEGVTAHLRAEIALATLPRDRWGVTGFNPGTDEGMGCSAVAELPSGGCKMFLNADTVSGQSASLPGNRSALFETDSARAGSGIIASSSFHLPPAE